MRKSAKLALIGMAALVTSCAEKAGTGELVALPVVTVSCTTAQCRTNTTAVVRVLVTNYNCDPNSDNFASASSSLTVNCTGSGGCFGSTSAWVDSRGAVSKIGSSTYNICGRIDYFPGNYPSVTNDDTTASLVNVFVSETSNSFLLSNWLDP